MAMEMLATIIVLPDDPTLTWDQREEQWKLSGKIYKTHNFTQSAEGNKDGLWTTVISTVHKSMRKFQYRYYMKCERLSPGVKLPNESS